jgi:hypothetical protein
VALSHRYNVIEQVAPTTFNPTLRNSILPGTFEGCPDGANLQGTNRCRDFQPIFPISVKSQKPGSRPKRKRVSQLLNDPSTSRVLRNVEVYDPPPTVADDEKAIEDAEGDRRNRKEIHRSDCFPVIAQKRKPTLGWFGISGCPAHPPGDRPLGDIKTEHEEFAKDARRSPRRIFGNHSEDQFPNFLRDPSPSYGRSKSGNQPPVQAETGPVPTDDRFRRNNDKSLLPFCPESTSGDPEEPVEQCKPRPRTPTLQDSEMLTKCEILQNKVYMTSKEANEDSESESKKFEHDLEL